MPKTHPARMIQSIDHLPIQLISAPCILGLKPSGVENLPASLISAGLLEKLNSPLPIKFLPTLNERYAEKRDSDTDCKNTTAIAEFSVQLGAEVLALKDKKHFPMVLGGDCSTIIGIMSGIAAHGKHGLIFLDAHADFYQPEKSITGEVADMDLAIVTGRGPAILTDIHHRRPYVTDENVIHIGQRDWSETKKYHSQDIKETSITCLDLETIKKLGMESIVQKSVAFIENADVDGFWIHFDTDVIADNLNPAVDYRLPGGLTFDQVKTLLKHSLATGRIEGVSVTIFNPTLDPDGTIAKNIVDCLANAFNTTL